MSAPATSPTIGVLDVDGLHLPDGSLAPVTGTIRHVGDLYNGARRHRLTQLWLTDAWVRAAELPDALAGVGQFREVRHAFVSDGLDNLHAFPTALTPWLDLRKKGETGSSVSIVFPLYDEHAVWRLDTDGTTLLDGLLAYNSMSAMRPYMLRRGRTRRSSPSCARAAIMYRLVVLGRRADRCSLSAATRRAASTVARQNRGNQVARH